MNTIVQPRKTTIINKLASHGEGCSSVTDETSGKPVYFPFTLPNEEVSYIWQNGQAQNINIERPSPLRVKPQCQHFMNCGGCSLQHFEISAYRDWKVDLVRQALSKRAINVKVDDIIPCQFGSRRRTRFAARKTINDFIFGYYTKSSNTIIPIEHCPVLVPGIENRLADIRVLAEAAAPPKGVLKIHVFESDQGLDIAFEDIAKLDEKKRQRLISLCLQLGFARVSLGDEILVERESPTVAFAGIDVPIPPSGFAQATKFAQDYMIEAVLTHLKGCKQVVDLFCGSGTFSLPLARQSKVMAVEFEPASLKALERTARITQGLKPLKTDRRDLFRRPVFAHELKYVNGLVFDPPRAGAEKQCHEIVKSNVRKIVAISCNPKTFARDAKILIDGGFKLERVTPLDQFLFSPHVEVIGLFMR